MVTATGPAEQRDVLGEIVAAIIGAVVAFAGVWLSQHHTERMTPQSLVERNRADQLPLITDLLIAGRQKLDLYELLLPVLARFDDKDDIQFTETETGRRMGVVNAEMSRSLAKATLFVGDPQLLEGVDDLRRLEFDFAENVVGRMLETRRNPADREPLLEGMRQIYVERHTLDRLEEVTVGLLRPRTVVAESPGWRSTWSARWRRIRLPGRRTAPR
jgi:hypothetical protein